MINTIFETRSCLKRLLTLLIVLPIAGVLLMPTPANAQYFGRNKVNYDSFDFKSFKTDHFEFYVYPEEEQAVKDASRPTYESKPDYVISPPAGWPSP